MDLPRDCWKSCPHIMATPSSVRPTDEPLWLLLPLNLPLLKGASPVPKSI